MAIKHLITQQIVRLPDTEAKLSKRSQELPLDGKSEELVRELKQVMIGKGGKSYGQISIDCGDFPSGGWLKNWLEEKLGFVSLCDKLGGQLASCLDQQLAEIDAYLVFAAEQLADSDNFYVFMLQHKEGQYLDSDLALEKSYFLDTSALLMAAKLDLTEWQKDDAEGYLTLMRQRGYKELSDAFGDAMGFADKVDIAAETQEFLEIVNRYSETLEEEKVQPMRAKLVDYCMEQSKKDEPVELTELSAQIDEEAPKAFVRYMSEQQKKQKEELIPDTRQLRQFVRISGRTDQLSMSFASDCLGESIVYNKEDDSLVIKSLPPSLKARLLKHLEVNKAPTEE